MSTHVTQSASFFLSLLQAWVSEGERNTGGGWGPGGENGGTLVFSVVGFQAVIVCVAFYMVYFVIRYILEIPASTLHILFLASGS